MEEINLVAILKSSEDNLNIKTKGLRNDKKIMYKENDVSVTLYLFNNKIKMSRTCKDYKIDLVFENNKDTISKYNVFDSPKVFELNTKTKKLNISDNKIDIKYELEGNDFHYLLKIGG